MLLLFAFYAYAFTSLFWAPSGGVGMDRFAVIVSEGIPAFLLGTAIIQNSESILRFQIGLILGVAIGAVHCAIWLIAPSRDLLVIFATVGGYQGLNKMLGMGAIAIVVALTYQSRRWWQTILGSVALIVLIIDMVVIGGLSGFLAFLGCTLLLLALRVDFDRVHMLRLTTSTIIFLAIIASFCVLGILVGISDQSILPRGLARIAIELRSTNQFTATNILMADSRFYLWHEAINIWARNPLFGSGLGSWSLLVGASDLNGIYAHNILLEILGELGLVGITLFLLPLFLLLQNLRKTWAQIPAANLSLCLLLVIFLFLHAMSMGNLDAYWTHSAIGLLFIAVNYRAGEEDTHRSAIPTA